VSLKHNLELENALRVSHKALYFARRPRFWRLSFASRIRWLKHLGNAADCEERVWSVTCRRSTNKLAVGSKSCCSICAGFGSKIKFVLCSSKAKQNVFEVSIHREILTSSLKLTSPKSILSTNAPRNLPLCLFLAKTSLNVRLEPPRGRLRKPYRNKTTLRLR
jgi:hypothetical protein